MILVVKNKPGEVRISVGVTNLLDPEFLTRPNVLLSSLLTNSWINVFMFLNSLKFGIQFLIMLPSRSAPTSEE